MCNNISKIEFNMLPKFIMTVGISGSGKSTTLLKQYKDCNIVSTDEIRIELTGNVSDQSKNRDVFRIANERVVSSLISNIDVVFDATNVDYTCWVNFVKYLPPCMKTVLIFYTDPEVAYNRIVNDISSGKNRSNVPKEAIYMQYKLFNTTIDSNVISEYFDEIVHIK